MIWAGGIALVGGALGGTGDLVTAGCSTIKGDFAQGADQANTIQCRILANQRSSNT